MIQLLKEINQQLKEQNNTENGVPRHGRSTAPSRVPGATSAS
jgi:hypothetical protein